MTTLAAAPEPVILTLASFAVTKLAYVRLTKLFRETYMKATGTDVRFRLTFAGSGVQARAVIDGLPADIVALALTLDVQKIADSGGLLLACMWPACAGSFQSHLAQPCRCGQQLVARQQQVPLAVLEAIDSDRSGTLGTPCPSTDPIATTLPRRSDQQQLEEALPPQLHCVRDHRGHGGAQGQP